MKIIPKHLMLETIRGVCNANCIMCDIATWRKTPHIQSQKEFEDILSQFLPYRDKLEFLSLYFRGEPLLDKNLVGKIKWAKDNGFKGIGVSTNCMFLDAVMSEKLMNAGMDTLIACVEGVKKETHEAIRVGTNFDTVIKNVLEFIRLRNEKYNSKVVVRLVSQKINIDEIEAFKTYWNLHLNSKYGDKVEVFPVVSCQGGTNLENYNEIDSYGDVKTTVTECFELQGRIIVGAKGDVGICCGDNSSRVRTGNVLETDPMEIYNNKIFTRYREMLKAGRKEEIEPCKGCTVPRSYQIKNGELMKEVA